MYGRTVHTAACGRWAPVLLHLGALYPKCPAVSTSLWRLWKTVSTGRAVASEGVGGTSGIPGVLVAWGGALATPVGPLFSAGSRAPPPPARGRQAHGRGRLGHTHRCG